MTDDVWTIDSPEHPDTHWRNMASGMTLNVLNAYPDDGYDWNVIGPGWTDRGHGHADTLAEAKAAAEGRHAGLDNVS